MRRPKHYDRPGKRPGPAGRGSIIDQRAPKIEICTCAHHPRFGVEIDAFCPLHGSEQ